MRNRGMVGHVLTDPEIVGPMGASYALFVRPSDGRMLMVHYEGVGYQVRDDKPWRWTDYSVHVSSYAPADLMEVIANDPTISQVDLADWIRVHNARLESNFRQIHDWLSQDAEVTA